jgi:hypothetical protein
MKIILALVIACLATISLCGQDFLPPAPPWKGKSLELIASPKNKWITPAETSGFVTTPDYQATMDWLRRLEKETDLVRMISIGRSLQGRDINMVIVSSSGDFTPEKLSTSTKPLLLFQAGIHAGEIDGKDAGMMLLRDIVFGSKKNLLSGVNVLFIPILNVDGHERASSLNRPNQRGPQNMGWRSNARNYNLNRDYTKLDTEEIRTIVSVINNYDPDLYIDIHVTDGADYQYDVTYGFSENYSPAIASWLRDRLRPSMDAELKKWGHIPGPIIFAKNDMDFADGMTEFPFSPRLSNAYGDARHLPTILIENHSLKPFRQRVLGTYVFLEGVIRLLEKEGSALRDAIEKDKRARPGDLVLSWKRSAIPDTIEFLGIEAQRRKSEITGSEYVVWNAKPVKQRIPSFRYTTPDKKTDRPKAFWIPSTYPEVISRLRLHGIQVEEINAPTELEGKFFKIENPRFSQRPTEGHFTVQGEVKPAVAKDVLYPGSVRVSTDQPLGDLAIILLHPDSPDSFFQWGFFPEIFSRTEYVEQYVMEPMAQKMLKEDAALKEEFDKKKQDDATFTAYPYTVYNWFYQKSSYMDKKWLIYPVGMDF